MKAAKGALKIKITKQGVKEILTLIKTKEGWKELYKQYKELFNYFIFGVGTTIISFGTYYLVRWIFPNEESVPVWLSWVFNITSSFGIESNTALPVILSWVFSVTFSFLTNRIYVFHSNAKNAWQFIKEGLLYYATRLATLAFDLIFMFLLVDLPKLHHPLYELCCKVMSNVIVLILNYILSRLFVFRKKKELSDAGKKKIAENEGHT